MITHSKIILAVTGLAVGVLWSECAEARVRWSTPGSYRLRLNQLDHFPIDASENTNNRGRWARHRLRIEPTTEIGPLTVHLQMDVLSGQILGQTEPVGAEFAERRSPSPSENYDGWTTVVPRQAWLEFDSPWARFALGQMSDHWGLGLVANGGERPTGRQRQWAFRFGDQWNGDLVDQIELSVRPLAPFLNVPMQTLTFSLAAGYIYEDEEASAIDGDSAVRFVARADYPGDEIAFGLRGSERIQTDEDGDEIELTRVNAYGAWEIPLILIGAEFRVRGELAYLSGRNGRYRTENEDTAYAIGAHSGAFQSDLAFICPWIALSLDGGWMSGDDSPQNGRTSAFVADPDFQVGLVLFNDVLRLITARNAERLRAAEDELEGVNGAEELPTHGSLANVMYLNPGVTWRSGGWGLGIGLLAAWSHVAFADPVASAGSEAFLSPLGDAPGRFYGIEADFRIRYSVPLGPMGRAEFGADLGVLDPGDALGSTLGGDFIGHTQLRADVYWQ